MGQSTLKFNCISFKFKLCKFKIYTCVQNKHFALMYTFNVYTCFLLMHLFLSGSTYVAGISWDEWLGEWLGRGRVSCAGGSRQSCLHAQTQRWLSGEHLLSVVAIWGHSGGSWESNITAVQPLFLILTKLIPAKKEAAGGWLQEDGVNRQLYERMDEWR